LLDLRMRTNGSESHHEPHAFWRCGEVVRLSGILPDASRSSSQGRPPDREVFFDQFSNKYQLAITISHNFLYEFIASSKDITVSP